VSDANSSLPVAAWYPDPTDASALRWWDGYAWTAHVTAPQQRPTTLAEAPAPQFDPRVAMQIIDESRALSSLAAAATPVATPPLPSAAPTAAPSYEPAYVPVGGYQSAYLNTHPEADLSPHPGAYPPQQTAPAQQQQQQFEQPVQQAHVQQQQQQPIQQEQAYQAGAPAAPAPVAAEPEPRSASSHRNATGSPGVPTSDAYRQLEETYLEAQRSTAEIMMARALANPVLAEAQQAQVQPQVVAPQQVAPHQPAPQAMPEQVQPQPAPQQTPQAMPEQPIAQQPAALAPEQPLQPVQQQPAPAAQQPAPQQPVQQQPAPAAQQPAPQQPVQQQPAPAAQQPEPQPAPQRTTSTFNPQAGAVPLAGAPTGAPVSEASLLSQAPPPSIAQLLGNQAGQPPAPNASTAQQALPAAQAPAAEPAAPQAMPVLPASPVPPAAPSAAAALPSTTDFLPSTQPTAEASETPASFVEGYQAGFRAALEGKAQIASADKKARELDPNAEAVELAGLNSANQPNARRALNPTSEQLAAPMHRTPTA
jgi:hypothetical protein